MIEFYGCESCIFTNSSIVNWSLLFVFMRLLVFLRKELKNNDCKDFQPIHIECRFSFKHAFCDERQSFFSLKKMFIFKSVHSNDLMYFDTVYIVVDWVYGRVQLKISNNQNIELKKYLMMHFKNLFFISSVGWKWINLVTFLIAALMQIAQSIKCNRTPTWVFKKSGSWTFRKIEPYPKMHCTVLEIKLLYTNSREQISNMTLVFLVLKIAA